MARHGAYRTPGELTLRSSPEATGGTISALTELRPWRRRLPPAAATVSVYAKLGNSNGESYFAAGTALATDGADYEGYLERAVEIVAFQIAAPSSGVTISCPSATLIGRIEEYAIGFGGASYPYKVIYLFWRVKPAGSTAELTATASASSRWASYSVLFNGLDESDPICTTVDTDSAPESGVTTGKERTLEVATLVPTVLFKMGGQNIVGGGFGTEIPAPGSRMGRVNPGSYTFSPTNAATDASYNFFFGLRPFTTT